ncbi:hypothetical protein HY994_01750 [Candidatus Micrarchaeota archaeon]|nr:hypothetical protein [Candidatus Micrarchaeota archaeon]
MAFKKLPKGHLFKAVKNNKMKTITGAITLLFAAILLFGCTQSPSTPAATTMANKEAQSAIETFGTATTNAAPTTGGATSILANPNTNWTRPQSTPLPPKLNNDALSRYLIQYTDAPHWVSWCKSSCEQVKYAIQDAACSVPRVDEFQNPLTAALNLSTEDKKNETKVDQFKEQCRTISPEVLFDCDNFREGTLSCGKQLAGCQDGGFLVQFNRTELMNLTSFEADAQIFIDSHAFKKLLDKDDCPKPA